MRNCNGLTLRKVSKKLRISTLLTQCNPYETNSSYNGNVTNLHNLIRLTSLAISIYYCEININQLCWTSTNTTQRKRISRTYHQKQPPELFYEKKVFLEILSPEACNYIKIGTLTQAFSCEFCEISKITFFTEHVWTTASVQF